MPTVKKLAFTIPFLLSLGALYSYLSIFLEDIYLIFSFNPEVLGQMVIFVLLFLIVGLFFAVLSALAQNLKIVLPAAFLGSTLTFIFIPPPISLVIFFGSIISFTLVFFTLSRKLSSYIDFKVSELLIPSVKTLSLFLLMTFSVVFYLSSGAALKKEGFQIPDSVIDPVITMSISNFTEGQPQAQKSQTQIPPEQLQMLRQNPALLKQYGLDPSVLDELSPQTSKTPQNPQQALIKNEVKRQINTLIQPQIQFLPVVLTALFFLTLKFGQSILSVLLYPALGLIFWILDKTGFTKYEKEMREVKKLVV